MRKLIILGSSRKEGNTKKVVDKLLLLGDFDTIDLNDYNISHYNYQNQNDDYMGLMKNILHKYDTFIFATPVYWYAMSGIMKVFFDRTTDLLDHNQELGRKLRKKNMAVISSSIGDHLEDKFWFPFIEFAKYLGITYIGHLHTITNQDSSDDLGNFARLLNQTCGKSSDQNQQPIDPFLRE